MNSPVIGRRCEKSELTCVPLGREQRTGHLPKLLQELVHRLRVPREMGTKQVSEVAVAHGRIRQSQGYSDDCRGIPNSAG